MQLSTNEIKWIQLQHTTALDLNALGSGLVSILTSEGDAVVPLQPMSTSCILHLPASSCSMCRDILYTILFTFDPRESTTVMESLPLLRGPWASTRIRDIPCNLCNLCNLSHSESFLKKQVFKSPISSGFDDLPISSKVQHLNFGATPSDYGTAGYATLSPMILKLSAEAQRSQSAWQTPVRLMISHDDVIRKWRPNRFNHPPHSNIQQHTATYSNSLHQTLSDFIRLLQFSTFDPSCDCTSWGEVVNTDCQSPTTASDRPKLDCIDCIDCIDCMRISAREHSIHGDVLRARIRRPNPQVHWLAKWDSWGQLQRFEVLRILRVLRVGDGYGPIWIGRWW